MVTENRPHFPDLARVFEKIIEEANEAIYLHTLDPDKPNFIMVNREACQMLGYYRDELLERGPAAIDSPRFAEHFKTDQGPAPIIEEASSRFADARDA